MTDRPKKPTRRLAGITAVFSGGKWKWRALVQRQGHRFVGTLRETQERAAADRESVRLRSLEDPERPMTLGEAIRELEAQARDRGLEEESVLGGYTRPGKVLMRLWPEDQAMNALDLESVIWMAKDSLSIGRSPLTVRRNYMGLLGQCFRAAGLPDPIPAAKKRLARQLRYVPPEMPWRPPEDVGAMLDRIETYEHKRGLPNQQEDLDLMTVIAFTSVRNWEFSRVLRQHVDLERWTMAIRKAKDRTHPRISHIPEPARNSLARLCEGLDADATLVRGGHRRLNRMFENWKKRLNVDDLNGRMLRHSFGTGMELLGAPETVTRNAMGHSANSKAAARYRHAAETHLAEHVRRLADAVQKGRQGDAHQEEEAREEE